MTTPAERARRGKAERARVPRSAHGGWRPADDRPDPLRVLARQEADRVPELLPIRHGRMAATPFGFYRGAAAVMAADLAAQPRTGLTVQLCGDAHLLNFGLYASPERALLFDVNDFDETLPGPFEWDVKRLAASVAVAAADNAHSDRQALRAATAAAEAYRGAMRRLAGLGELAVWYDRIDIRDVLPLVRRRNRPRAAATIAQARRRTSLQALRKLTRTENGRPRIISDPPLLEPAPAVDHDVVHKVFAAYRATLPEHRHRLLDRFEVVDVAQKVVGVGSVGTRCFIVLLTGRDLDDPLFLQVKQAERSVLEPHLTASAHHHHGHRVVAGQQLLQTASDIFLGWATGPLGRHFYWRQLRDMKGSVEVDTLDPRTLRRYAALCGTALARGHARTGDRIAIASYLGGGSAFDQAIGDFAMRYMRQNTADHAALTAAVAAGDVAAVAGV